MGNITAYSSNDVKAQVQLIQQVMQAVMKEGEHFGIIPGTKKNTLFQSGAQKLLVTFRLGSEPEVINIDETDSSVSYRVKVRLFNIVDGNTVGYGIGECSSLEDKYCWRKAVNDAEYDATAENKKRLKYGTDYQTKRDYAIKQVQTNYKDVSNTILKMATKRALIGAVLTATAAGDIFTQDLEDMEPHTRDSIIDAETYDNTTGEVLNPKSLQTIRDGVTALGLKTFIKEEEGKQLLIVAGKTFEKKDLLAKMGFKTRKPDGSQYWETYMDVTSLDAQKPSVANNAIDRLIQQIKQYGFEGIGPSEKKGNYYIMAKPLSDNSDFSALAEIGFGHHNGKYIMKVNHFMPKVA